MGAPKMKPRDSMPTTTSTSRVPMRSMSPSTAALNESPSLRSVVMSLKRIPGLGKSGMSRMRDARSLVVTATAERLMRLAEVRAFVDLLEPAGIAVEDEHREVGVVRPGAIELRKDPEEVRYEDAGDSTVTDHEHRAARCLPRQTPQRLEAACEDLIQRLAVRPRHEAVVAPVWQGGDLVPRCAGLVADIDLDQVALDLDRHAHPLRDDLRCVERPVQRGRDDPVEFRVRERVGDDLRLAPPAFGQRAIATACEAACRVGLALAVAHEIEGGGRGHATASWSATPDQPFTRVMSGCSTSRFHGWSKRYTRTPASARLREMRSSSSQNASRRSSCARRVLYCAEPVGSYRPRGWSGR